MISTVTDSIVEESRSLAPMYPVVFFDALRWIEQTEGAKFWLKSAPISKPAAARAS